MRQARARPSRSGPTRGRRSRCRAWLCGDPDAPLTGPSASCGKRVRRDPGGQVAFVRLLRSRTGAEPVKAPRRGPPCSPTTTTTRSSRCCSPSSARPRSGCATSPPPSTHLERLGPAVAQPVPGCLDAVAARRTWRSRCSWRAGNVPAHDLAVAVVAASERGNGAGPRRRGSAPRSPGSWWSCSRSRGPRTPTEHRRPASTTWRAGTCRACSPSGSRFGADRSTDAQGRAGGAARHPAAARSTCSPAGVRASGARACSPATVRCCATAPTSLGPWARRRSRPG